MDDDDIAGTTPDLPTPSPNGMAEAKDDPIGPFIPVATAPAE